MHISLRKIVCTALVAFLSIFFMIPVSAASLKGKTVLIDGDSLARGSHATTSRYGTYSYGDYLKSRGAKVTNIAMSGARMYYPGGGSEKMANHLTKSIKNKAFDYIILQGGDNDVDYYSDLSNTYNAIASYFNTVKKNPKWKNSKVFFVITPHMDRNSGTLNRANNLWKKVKKLCSKYHITCINFFKISKNDGNTVPSGFKYNLMSNRIEQSRNNDVEGSVDGSHPSKKAHIAMGKVIEKELLAVTKDEKKSSSSKGRSSSGKNSKSNKNKTTNTSSVSGFDGTVDTTFFGSISDDGNGCGVYMILNLVIDILSTGIGILGLIGITVVGTKYLTAKDSEEQVRKAKRRMLEIIIGLVAFVLLYFGLQFLLPGGKFNFDQQCAPAPSQSQSSS